MVSKMRSPACFITTFQPPSSVWDGQSQPLCTSVRCLRSLDEVLHFTLNFVTFTFPKSVINTCLCFHSDHKSHAIFWLVSTSYLIITTKSTKPKGTGSQLLYIWQEI